ncbi:MAG: hypothetical protein K2G63_03560, partial [Oscillospiraceae bacterium]|nr:hypothetical protein [Oscillospiraceae bacterium]
MKNFDSNFEKSFEKELSQKMNELSSNVNCFDKIAKKAFPSDDTVSEDGYYSESGLENITGKKHFSFIPVLTTVFVLFLGSFLVIQGSFKEFFSNIKQHKEEYYNTFSDLKSELDYELKSFNYNFYDLDYDDYVMNISCINPLINKELIKQDENTKVRIYTKTFQINQNRTETNQIYIVHYINEYCDENIISITDTKAKFNSEDQYNAYPMPQKSITWDNVICPNMFSSYYLAKRDEMDNNFQINYRFLYKEEESNKIYDLFTSGIFWFERNVNEDVKHYDIVSVYTPTDEPDAEQYYNIDIDDLWNDTVYQYEEPMGFDNNKEKNLFIKENLTEYIINEQGLNIFIADNDYRNEDTMPNYCQKLTTQRDITVKTLINVNLRNISVYFKYSNDLEFSNRISKENDVKPLSEKLTLFDYQNISDLYSSCEFEIFENALNSFSDEMNQTLEETNAYEKIKEIEAEIKLMEYKTNMLSIDDNKEEEEELKTIITLNENNIKNIYSSALMRKLPICLENYLTFRYNGKNISFTNHSGNGSGFDKNDLAYIISLFSCDSTFDEVVFYST